jgi:hypothetical protein
MRAPRRLPPRAFRPVRLLVREPVLVRRRVPAWPVDAFRRERPPPCVLVRVPARFRVPVVRRRVPPACRRLLDALLRRPPVLLRVPPVFRMDAVLRRPPRLLAVLISIASSSSPNPREPRVPRSFSRSSIASSFSFIPIISSSRPYASSRRVIPAPRRF